MAKNDRNSLHGVVDDDNDNYYYHYLLCFLRINSICIPKIDIKMMIWERISFQPQQFRSIHS